MYKINNGYYPCFGQLIQKSKNLTYALSEPRFSFCFWESRIRLFLDGVYCVEVSSFLIPEKQLWEMATWKQEQCLEELLLSLPCILFIPGCLLWRLQVLEKPSALGYFVSDSVKEEVSCSASLQSSDPYFACIKGIEKSAGILVKTQGRWNERLCLLVVTLFFRYVCNQWTF